MVTWASNPLIKIEFGANDVSSETFITTVHRPENAISRAVISANDYQGKNYIANVDISTVIKVSLRYAADGWTQVFEGIAEYVGPSINTSKQSVELIAYGYGRALRNTCCSSNYGNESESPTLDTPHEIWDDLIANMINKSFGGANTGYAITNAKIAACANPSINFLAGNYRSNFTMINDVLTAYQGYRDEASGMHWFVDESQNLFINTIAAHENNATGWPTWWDTDLAGSTLVEGVDFIDSFFHKKLTNFANKVVLYCDLRKPGTDIWTEDGGPAWGNDAYTTVDYSADQFIVGSHSLRLINGIPQGWAYYPSTEDAAWDLTRIGSEKSIPTLNFYFYKEAAIGDAATGVNLATTDHDTDYFYVLFDVAADPDDEWIHRSIPVGPNWKTHELSRRYRWGTNGNPVWTDINCVTFYGVSASGTKMYVDDLHFAGKIIREAYNSTSITANDEVQKIIRYDVAVDDSMTVADDTGTAGRLAYGELLTRQVIPTVGVIVTPLAVHALPGQLIHIHADAYSPFGAADFRVNATFRVKEVVHTFAVEGAVTTWDLTSDVLNTFVTGFNDSLTQLHKVMQTDPEMKNLKSTGLDPYVTRLSIDYP